MSEQELKNNLINAYKDLSTDAKRNELNLELIKIGNIINTYLKKYDNEEYEELINYVEKSDAILDEDQVLVQNYTNIIQIKNNLMLLLKYMER